MAQLIHRKRSNWLRGASCSSAVLDEQSGSTGVMGSDPQRKVEMNAGIFWSIAKAGHFYQLDALGSVLGRGH